MFIKSKTLGKTQVRQLESLLERGVELKELIFEETPRGLHYIFAYYHGKTQHFYISDEADENHALFVVEGIWKALKAN